MDERQPFLRDLKFILAPIGVIFGISLFISLFLWLLLTFIQSKREEKELKERFGREYTEYKEKTPMFIPNFRELLKDLALTRRNER